MTIAIARPPAGGSAGGESTATYEQRAPSHAGRTGLARRQRRIDAFVSTAIATTGLVLLGARIELLTGVTVGVLFCVALAPLWLRAIREHRGATVLTALGLLAVGVGLALQVLNPGGHHFSTANAVASIGYAATIPIVAGFVLWARRVAPPWALTISFGVGLLLGIDRSSDLFASNPWKFGYALPATLIVLGLAQSRRSRVLEFATLILFAGVLFVSDARSGLGILLVSAALVAWQLRPGLTTKRRSAARFGAVVIVIACAVYQGVTSLIIDGALGAETQSRTLEQLRSGGSLLLGGRPELGATWAMLRAYPTGLGPGAAPTLSDLRTAQKGMSSIGYDPDNGYVYNYMFGGHVELHSVIGDLWAPFGVGGLMFVAVALWILVRGITVGTVTASINGTAVYLGILSLWNVGFGPIGTSYIILAVALGLLISPGSPMSAGLRRAGPTRADRRDTP